MHADYARKTLYAYMPCAELRGADYVDEVVLRHYDNNYTQALYDFVMDPSNLWCPKWIHRNYVILNKMTDNATGPAFPDDQQELREETSEKPQTATAASETTAKKFPFADHYKRSDYAVFAPAEPEQDPDAHETFEARPPPGTTPWDKENRTNWQLHSQYGPNPDPEGLTRLRKEVPFEDLVNPLQPGIPYDAYWEDHVKTCDMMTWPRLKTEDAAYSDETLSRDTLGDDHQQLFVAMLLDHVHYVLECVRRKKQPKPLRLFLLGSAGAGKTRAVQTALQETKRVLRAVGLPMEIDPAKFVRVGAPTGSAAFNLRFNATTVHRLIHWFRPPHFAELTSPDRIDRLQKHLAQTEFIILDEISMVGRQMMGRIDSRLCQARAGKNEADYSLGGISCVAVGDPAQCEAIMDQQLYDVASHRQTADAGERPSVLLSNRGLSVYAEFTKVIILTKAHRLTKVENPETEEDHAFNDRADRFVNVLRRLRDLEWTVEDYYWLCKRKRGYLSLREREAFADAPVIMDFRKQTEDNPEDNCDFYNKAYLRQMAHAKKIPIVRIDAQHEGIDQSDGMAMPEETFNGLLAALEVAEEARVILTSNLGVEHGLMNGTQGILKRIVFNGENNPNHEDHMKRQPEVLVVDFPKYAGPRFYADPDRATWVPLRAMERDAEGHDGVLRRQFPLILGWAMTPWKAQGMTLDRAIVRLTKAASAPGVAFVALSRVRHPDHLMLEDSFPDMSTIMRQLQNQSYQTRQRWERQARVKFSRTLRQHMRDPDLYSAENLWTSQDSAIADNLVAAFAAAPNDEETDVAARCRDTYPSEEHPRVDAVIHRMGLFPHVFEIAAARGRLGDYDLAGNALNTHTYDITHVSYQGWSVALREINAFLAAGTIEPATFEFFAKLIRPHLPATTSLRNTFDLRKIA